jgi:hypothetical protein
LGEVVKKQKQCDYKKCSMPTRDLDNYYISEPVLYDELLMKTMATLGNPLPLKKYFHPRCHIRYREELVHVYDIRGT